MRSLLSALALAALVVSASGCDTTDDTALNVFVVDLGFDNQQYRVSNDTRVASFDARDARVSRGNLEAALRTVGDGALVMLYIDVEQVQNVDGAQGNTTWTALPLTRSFEELVLADDGAGNTIEIPVVGYTASYEYSFDNGDLNFDVVSSAPASDFSDDPTLLFDAIVPQRADGTSRDVNLRLVTIPDELFLTGAGARIDLRDYQAVQAAYGLPD